MTQPTPEAYEAAFRAVDDGDYNTAQIAVDAVWPIAEATVRAKVAAEIRQHAQDEIRLQSSWLWHALGEERLIEVADRFAARIAEGNPDGT